MSGADRRLGCPEPGRVVPGIQGCSPDSPAVERARITVQRRVREAIKKIADHEAELGRHLDWAVRTGTYCAYEPLGRGSANPVRGAP